MTLLPRPRTKLKNISAKNKSLQDILITMKDTDVVLSVESFKKGIHNTRIIIQRKNGEKRVQFYNRIDLNLVIPADAQFDTSTVEKAVNDLNTKYGCDFTTDDLEIKDNKIYAKETSLGYFADTKAPDPDPEPSDDPIYAIEALNLNNAKNMNLQYSFAGLAHWTMLNNNDDDIPTELETKFNIVEDDNVIWVAALDLGTSGNGSFHRIANLTNEKIDFMVSAQDFDLLDAGIDFTTSNGMHYFSLDGSLGVEYVEYWGYPTEFSGTDVNLSFPLSWLNFETMVPRNTKNPYILVLDGVEYPLVPGSDRFGLYQVNPDDGDKLYTYDATYKEPVFCSYLKFNKTPDFAVKGRKGFDRNPSKFEEIKIIKFPENETIMVETRRLNAPIAIQQNLNKYSIGVVYGNLSFDSADQPELLGYYNDINTLVLKQMPMRFTGNVELTSKLNEAYYINHKSEKIVVPNPEQFTYIVPNIDTLDPKTNTLYVKAQEDDGYFVAYKTYPMNMGVDFNEVSTAMIHPNFWMNKDQDVNFYLKAITPAFKRVKVESESYKKALQHLFDSSTLNNVEPKKGMVAMKYSYQDLGIDLPVVVIDGLIKVTCLEWDIDYLDSFNITVEEADKYFNKLITLPFNLSVSTS